MLYCLLRKKKRWTMELKYCTDEKAYYNINDDFDGCWGLGADNANSKQRYAY